VCCWSLAPTLRLGEARFLPHPFRFIIHVTRPFKAAGRLVTATAVSPGHVGLPVSLSCSFQQHTLTHEMCAVLGASNRGPAVERLHVCFISDFRREVGENCALLGHYAASNGNFWTTFQNNLSGPSSSVENQSLNPEDGTDRLSRNVGKKLLLFAA
jgi:hypothetical protein